ncbi:conserved exported hypothetical protein [Candidatus Sulfopaludibacter sp. SbA3]|nr:conserved exported hypothetical protein [Candidatus Sulfopaludibacter sp. SbA3]
MRALLLLVVTGVSLFGQAKTAIPRAQDGHPDLQGIWTNATITPLERPAALANKPTLTDAEATVFEKMAAKDLADVDGKSEHPLLAAAGSNGTGGYNVLFIDRGSEFARVDGVKRTSLIVDPPDGKVPALTGEARQRNMAAARGNNYDSVKNRPPAERCLVGFGSTSGPPMLPVLYNNNYQIVQTAGRVMILVEMVHDARIVRIGGTHAASNVRQWLGDSVGHWEGDTLVVDTTNFTDKNRFHGSGENLHVIERFTRTGASTILYRATIDDPITFTRQWTLEFPFVAAQGPIYEYACHEGNYALTDILGGARKADK